MRNWSELGLALVILFVAPSCSPAVPSLPAPTASDTPADPPPPTPAASAAPTPAEEMFSEITVPDIIFHNGIVLTMDEQRPQVEAIALADNLILAVGADEALLSLATPDTRVVDLNGRTLLPGFIDSHGHWIGDNEITGFSSVDETIQFMVENGWTSVNELFVSQERLITLEELDQEGRLRVRVNAYLPVNYLDQRFGQPFLEYTPGEVRSRHVRVAGVKLFVDNQWGATINWEQDELNNMVQAVHQAGWQAAIHTFSVQGHNMTLEALAFALQGEDNSAYRHRIEHVALVTDEQIAEIRQQGYIASIQLNSPTNIPQADPEFYELVPAQDLALVSRWQDLHEAGVMLVGSTDWPWYTNDTYGEAKGAPPGSPLRLLYKAATNIGPQGRAPEDWMRDQALPIEAALAALTINGAYATFEEQVKGSLVSGKWADIVVLSENPLTASVDTLAEIEVLMTMIGGKVEYCAEDAVVLCGLDPEQGAGAVEVEEGQVVLPAGGVLSVAIQGPVTGQLAEFYAHMENVAQMALAEHGPLRTGFSIQFLPVDDRCDQFSGATAAEQLLEQQPQVVAVIGPLCSAAAMGSLPIYQEAGLVSVSGSATQANLTALFGEGGFNRTVLSDQQFSELGITEMAIDPLAEVQSFYTRYESQYGPLPAEIRPLMAFTYDAVQVLLAALDQVSVLTQEGQLSIERLALAEAVRTTEDFAGVTGPVRFDEQGDRIPEEIWDQ